ncbi:MarR family transcriptional regulator [Crenobacter sp. SG2305]|uniref:MarR family winged helix-turn-helix transcriptional regulator n=1 Tax=Crenobacter oryzisoli TaxID=3056844 RepID=UPI0025AA6B49|nr:MarR family transcriptional regulator [Crenobacter sp. SG2305]MDN0083867.1 MarR family transcriptional regulator [Crenobacter sp. SG2305]
MNSDPIIAPRSYQEAEERIARVYQRLPGSGEQNTALLTLIKHLWKWLAEGANAELGDSGLNIVSFSTLLMLYSAPGSSVNPSELSQCTGETRTNMTRICNELEQLGLICRAPCPTDRRRVDLALSERGAELMDGLLPKLRARSETAFQVLSDTEKDTLESLLKKLLLGFEQHG